MRVAFFGTPEVAAAGLDSILSSDHDVAVVVTQPDRARGRGRQVSASPVKELARAHGLDVLQPASPKDDGFVARLASFEPDALAVVAYGHILPVTVLEVAPAMNVHFSLLPAYRGAAPVQRAVMDGVSETGVSVFMLEPTIDTGPVVAVDRIPVGSEDTAGDVFDRLTPMGARLLVEALDGLEAGTLQPRPQDDSSACPAPKIRPEEAQIRWERPARDLANLVRGLNPRPGAHTLARGKRLGVWRARPVPAEAPAGVVDRLEPGLVVGCGDGEGLELIEVQPAGKKRMSGAEFARGYRPSVGAPIDEG